jgi:hypothetical protein
VAAELAPEKFGRIQDGLIAAANLHVRLVPKAD